MTRRKQYEFCLISACWRIILFTLTFWGNRIISENFEDLDKCPLLCSYALQNVLNDQGKVKKEEELVKERASSRSQEEKFIFGRFKDISKQPVVMNKILIFQKSIMTMEPPQRGTKICCFTHGPEAVLEAPNCD